MPGIVLFLNFLRWFQPIIARPALLATLVAVNVIAYFGGLLYWYGLYIKEQAPPIWAWIFIPDCPLFGLLGGYALLMVVANKYWSKKAKQQGRNALLGVGFCALFLWLLTYIPFMSQAFPDQRAMLAIFSWITLLFGIFFQQQPAWLLSITLFGNIKYGLWTVSAWLIFWSRTADIYGAPLFTPDSIAMTTTHLGMIAQGLFLLCWFKPTRIAALAALLWFGLSDFVDYGLGYFPPLPDIIPLSLLQWSTISVTVLLTLLLYSLSKESYEHRSRFEGSNRLSTLPHA